MIKKNRERLSRGLLKNFSDLPEKHQKNLLLVKNFIQKFINTDVFIYGSFYWGNWDEESDYDVIINVDDSISKLEIHLKLIELKKMIKNEINLNVDILIITEKIGILIP